MKKTHIGFGIAASLIALMPATAALAQTTDFQGLGQLPGYHSDFELLSANGAVAAGITYDAITFRQQASFWSTATGIKQLGWLAPSGISASSYVEGVSADGTVVVGNSTYNAIGQSQAFRWTETTGMQGLGFLGSVTLQSSANDVSANGSVVVGYAYNDSNGREAFRWTETGGMRGLGYIDGLNGVDYFSSAIAVNADGSVVVGVSTNADGITQEAFRWTEATGMRGLGFVDGGGSSPYSIAELVSADGSVVAGIGTNAASYGEAFRWTEETGIQGLGFIGGGGISPYSIALGMNTDGSVIIGYSSNPSDQIEAFRWTAAGMQGLGHIDGGGISPYSVANGVSANGAVVVGYSTTADDLNGAFRWTATTGMQSVAGVLSAAGVSLGTWNLNVATAVSADGSIILGSAINPDGDFEPWIARIPAPVDPELPSPPPVAGFISLPEIRVSMADTSMKIVQSQQVSFSALSDIRSAALEQCRLDGPGDENGRFCAFVSGSSAFWTGNGDSHSGDWLSGSAGLAMKIAPGTVAGAAFNAGKGSYDLRLSGSNDLTSYGGSAFVSYAQSGREGLQMLVAGSIGHLDLDVTRNYMNGTVKVSSSKGTASGQAMGALGRVGWGLKALERTWLTPFVELEWSRVTNGAYTETGGPFPIAFDRQTARETDIRAGVSMRHDLTDKVELFASAAWAHRLSGESGALKGVMVDIFNVGSSGPKLKDDWAELSAGASWAIMPQTRVSGALSTSLGSNDKPGIAMRVGLSSWF